MKPTLDDTEALVLDVIRGQRPFVDGLRAVVAYQRAWNPALNQYWQQHGFDVAPTRPGEVPAVPTDVFRHARIASRERPPNRVFRTSGTTSGARGEAFRISTRAYDLGAAVHFRACAALADVRAFPSLVFDPERVPDSSLSYMVGVLAADLRASASYHLRPDGLDTAGFATAVERADGPVVVFATAFALVHLLDSADPIPPLPDGSLVFETGGFKGRTRSLDRPSLCRATARRLGVPPISVRSEYSMTELSSQLYSLPDDPDRPPRFAAAPWCAVCAADPLSLEPLPTGATGLLRFVDLANVDTAVAIQTSDLGRVDDGGFVHLDGRAPGATPRGCSLAAEEVLEVARTRRPGTR